MTTPAATASAPSPPPPPQQPRPPLPEVTSDKLINLNVLYRDYLCGGVEVPSFKVQPLNLAAELDKLDVHSSTTLLRKSKYLIIPANGRFYYVKLALQDGGAHLLKVVGPSPSVLREGFVVFNSEIYYVTIDDIKRRIVRKSRRLKLKASSITYEDFLSGNIYPKPKRVSSPTVGSTGPDGDQKPEGFTAPIERTELEAANMALQEQMQSLLGAGLKEEIGWGEDWEEEGSV